MVVGTANELRLLGVSRDGSSTPGVIAQPHV